MIIQQTIAISTTLLWLLLAINVGPDDPTHFFDRYRAFWYSRVINTQRNLTLPLSHGQATRIDPAQTKEIAKRVEDLKQIFRLYQDSTGIELSRSKELFLLSFTDPRTSLQRTYVWNASHKLYFEQYLAQPLGARRWPSLSLKHLPQANSSLARRVVTKDDTLQTLLSQRNLRALQQLAYEHQVNGGEACLGLIYQDRGQASSFTPVDLPGFEFVYSSRN